MQLNAMPVIRFGALDAKTAAKLGDFLAIQSGETTAQDVYVQRKAEKESVEAPKKKLREDVEAREAEGIKAALGEALQHISQISNMNYTTESIYGLSTEDARILREDAYRGARMIHHDLLKDGKEMNEARFDELLRMRASLKAEEKAKGEELRATYKGIYVEGESYKASYEAEDAWRRQYFDRVEDIIDGFVLSYLYYQQPAELLEILKRHQAEDTPEIPERIASIMLAKGIAKTQGLAKGHNHIEKEQPPIIAGMLQIYPELESAFNALNNSHWQRDFWLT